MSIPVSGVSELVLEVADLAAAERFYAGTLGLPVVERWPDREAIWLMAGDRTRIGLWRPRLGVAGGRGGAHVHFALYVADDQFGAAVARLSACGLEPQVTERRRDPGFPDRSVYVDDPDGNCVELWTRDVSAYVPDSRPRIELPHEAHAPEHFDATAEQWDSSYDERTLRAHRRRARLERVVEMVGDPPGSLLEVGVGSGRLLEALAERGWSVAGIDAAPRMVDLARTRVPASADEVTVARAESLPFEDEKFDVVVAIGVLEYTDIESSLRELARVLRPGGRAVVGLRGGRSPAAAWWRTVVLPTARMVKAVAPVGRPLPKRRRRPLSPRRTRELLNTVGLEIERIELVGCVVVPDPLDRVVPRTAYRAAKRAEQSPRLRGVFGSQRVILARKRLG